MEKKFTLKPMYKYEIAEELRICKKTMMMWIKGSDLIEQLYETGYNGQRLLTLLQVELILKELGTVPNGQRVPVRSYTKAQLCVMYGICEMSLINHINSIPDKSIVKMIMKGYSDSASDIKKHKKRFHVEEVKLIFQYLGHPFIA